MRNLADAIENFIIRQLLEDREDAVLVQRNELADKLSCAPSQISYVLSTRFTPERGFMVEILDADEAKKRAVLETAITKMTERE